MIGSLDAGGVQAFAYNVSRALEGPDFHFDFAVDHSEYDFYKKPILELGCKLYCLEELSLANAPLYVRQWDEFFAKHPEIDVVHGHSRSTAAVYLASAKKKGAVTMAHSHSTSNGRTIRGAVKDLTKQFIWKNSDYYLACSEEAGRWLYGCHWRKSAPSEVIPNAVDSRRFGFSMGFRRQVRCEFDIKPDVPVFGHVGRFNEVKNHEYLVDVFSKILEMVPDAILVLVGDGELRPKITGKARELGIESSVRFIGNVADTAPFYSAMDAFLFPSLYEGIPLCLIEAQSSKLPIVVSDGVDSASFVEIDRCKRVPLDSFDKWVTVAVAMAGLPISDRGESVLIRKSPYAFESMCARMAELYSRASLQRVR